MQTGLLMTEKKNNKMISVIKKIVLILTFINLNNLLNAQQFEQVEFEFCEEMIKSKQFDMLDFSLVVKGDTFPFPRIGQNKYLNPISFFQIQYNPTDTIYMVVESRKYIFSFDVDHRFLNYERQNFCIKRYRNRLKKYQYSMGWTLGISGPCQVKKK